MEAPVELSFEKVPLAFRENRGNGKRDSKVVAIGVEMGVGTLSSRRTFEQDAVRLGTYMVSKQLRNFLVTVHEYGSF